MAIRAALISPTADRESVISGLFVSLLCPSPDGGSLSGNPCSFTHSRGSCCEATRGIGGSLGGSGETGDGEEGLSSDCTEYGSGSPEASAGYGGASW